VNGDGRRERKSGSRRVKAEAWLDLLESIYWMANISRAARWMELEGQESRQSWAARDGRKVAGSRESSCQSQWGSWVAKGGREYKGRLMI